MGKWLVRVLGLDVKKRIEESPGELVIDLRRVYIKDKHGHIVLLGPIGDVTELRVPIKFDFPEE